MFHSQIARLRARSRNCTRWQLVSSCGLRAVCTTSKQIEVSFLSSKKHRFGCGTSSMRAVRNQISGSLSPLKYSPAVPGEFRKFPIFRSVRSVASILATNKVQFSHEEWMVVPFNPSLRRDSVAMRMLAIGKRGHICLRLMVTFVKLETYIRENKESVQK